MDLHGLSVSVPKFPRYVELFDFVAGQGTVTHLDAAVAYATLGGVEALNTRMKSADGARWKSITKRWLIGIDWCRSEPLALKLLKSLPKSDVRIFNGKTVVKRPGCTPVRTFHPKAFMFSSDSSIAIVFGSGNLSRNGLRRGVEIGGAISARRPTGSEEKDSWQLCQAAKERVEELWLNADPLDHVLADYRKAYLRRDELKRPAITDDDEAPTEKVTRRRTVTPVLLRQLRACENLWIEAGNLHKNLGDQKPGNQLMMSPMTRVFFGCPAEDLSPDTFLGDVRIRYGASLRDCTLRFSNNSMDVLSLPVPGAGGPEAYDSKVLLFSETVDSLGRIYDLSIGTAAAAKKWKENSEQIDAAVKMTSGRQWGVF